MGRAQSISASSVLTCGRLVETRQPPPIQGRLFLNASRLWAGGLGDVLGLLNGGCLEGTTSRLALLPLQRVQHGRILEKCCLTVETHRSEGAFIEDSRCLDSGFGQNKAISSLSRLEILFPGNNGHVQTVCAANPRRCGQN
jgi:hypothetical protein